MDNRLYNVKPLKCCEPDEKSSKCHGLYEIVNNIVKENIKDKQNKLIAGDNITIKDDVISATGGGGSVELLLTDWGLTDESAVDYIKNKPTNVSSFVNDAGYLTEHLDISGKQDKLTAGDRIIIEENVISAQDSVASDVSYDNSKSGLTATNVQNAIDEMADTNLYETVVLTVGSADSSFNPVGQTITVTLEDGSATQYTVPMSRQITFIVQRGMRYTISGTSTDDYRVLPISVKAAIPIRYLTMRYIPIATGVFILQKDGNYYLREEYDAETMAKDAVGVLVLTSALIKAGQGIVIGKNDTETSSYDYWSYGRTKTLGNARFPSKTTIIGRSNTVSMVGFGGYPAAEYLNSLTLSTDEMDMPGYLMSYLEATILAANNTEIAECLQTIGGVAKNFAKNNTYYTSTDVRTDPTISAFANNESKRSYAGMNKSNLQSSWKANVIPVYKFQLS